MGLADKLRAGVITKTLILDCERLPGQTTQYWWDRGDLKNRYIHYESVDRMPRTTIVCAKWYDSPDIITLCEWDRGGRPRFLRRIHNLLSQAQIVVGHNIDSADVPWLLGSVHIEGGLPPLPPFKTFDTLKALRSKFKSQGAPFKSLDAICSILNLPAKIDRYDREAMERAVNERSKPDRERLIAYCCADVIAAQALYDWVKKFSNTHPTLQVAGKDSMTVCHRCGHDTEPIARRFIANIMSYSMRQCVSPECGAYSRISVEPERMSIVRSV